jgi:hypothetical protein
MISARVHELLEHVGIEENMLMDRVQNETDKMK